MKIYDKEMYKKQESMRMTVIIIVVFLLGFFAGYIASSSFGKGTNTETNNVNNHSVIESVNFE